MHRAEAPRAEERRAAETHRVEAPRVEQRHAESPRPEHQEARHAEASRPAHGEQHAQASHDNGKRTQ